MTFDVNSDLKSSTANQLRQEKQSISSQLLHVQQQISDLAFCNYRTYADAGSTTEHCRKRFAEASELVDSIDSEIIGLRECLSNFRERNVKISQEVAFLKSAESKESPLWDMLSLPTRMDVCIRAGYYEDAYLLTNYGMQLQQHGLTKNPLIKTVSNKLVEARHHLLNELFNQFAGPIDLASSIQVVNNIRKIPCLSPTQLRISVLHYRDLFLEKQVMNIRSQPDFILRMVEVYRDCMYDTMVMHLAVFPENESLKRDSNVDPRWDVWHAADSSAVLSEWAFHNLETMFGYIRDCEDSALDIGALSSKLMSFAASFGRIGVDFRPMVASVVQEFVSRKFLNSVVSGALRFAECEVIAIDGDIPDELTTVNSTFNANPTPSAALTFWDDLCVYGNGVIEAMNQLRNGLSPILVCTVLDALTKSLKIVFKWLDGFADISDHREKLAKAVKLIVRYFLPYLHCCLLILFPYERCCRPFYNTVVSFEEYGKRCAIPVNKLYEDCRHVSIFEEIIGETKSDHEEVSALKLNAEASVDILGNSGLSKETERCYRSDNLIHNSVSSQNQESGVTNWSSDVIADDDELVFTAKRPVEDKNEFSEISLA